MAELINADNYQDFTLETLKSPDGITKLNGLLRQLAQNISGDTEQVRVFSGVGTPESSVAAGVGSLYMRTDGGSDTSVYRKESGSGDTGWVAVKSPASLPLSVANGGTGVDFSSGTSGYYLYFSSTGVIGSVAPLASAVTLVSNTAVSAASTTGEIAITNTEYYEVKAKFTDMSANDTFLLRFNADTGAQYYYVNRGFDFDATPTARNAAATVATSILVSPPVLDTAATEVVITLRIYPQSPESSGSFQYVKGEVITIGSAASISISQDISGWFSPDVAATITSFSILCATATFSGNVYLYKYPRS